MTNAGLLRTLLALKLRLLVRTLTRGSTRSGLRFAGMLLLFAVAFAPIWLAPTAAAYTGARRLGAPAVVTGLGLVQLAWIAGSLLLGSFAEGFDLRLLLRYPVPARTAFWLNVLVAPFELTALFLFPPIGALVAGSAAHGGRTAAVLVALAALVLLLTTSALTQALMALLGRFLRREWTRAVFGLLLGLVFAVPAFVLRGAVPGRRASVLAHAEGLVDGAAQLFVWWPTTALPARAAAAALAADPARAVAFVLAGAAFLFVLVDLCARLALSEALNRQAPTTGDSASQLTGRGLEARLEAVLPVDLAFLVTRELRTYLRTPQLLIGFFMSPLIIVMVTRDGAFGKSTGPFFVAFAALITALNLSANQFGLDQAGVRFLFLLPVPARRLLLAKNLAVTAVTVVAAAAGLCAAHAVGTSLDAMGSVTAIVTLVAALPVVLAFGNRLSISHPWRMTFRMGGAPPGAVVSAFAQMAAIAAVGVALCPGLVILPAVFGDALPIRFASLAITSALAAVLWFLWTLFLSSSAQALDQGRERLIDRLARPGETG
jgi:predicted permease